MCVCREANRKSTKVVSVVKTCGHPPVDFIPLKIIYIAICGFNFQFITATFNLYNVFRIYMSRVARKKSFKLSVESIFQCTCPAQE